MNKIYHILKISLKISAALAFAGAACFALLWLSIEPDIEMIRRIDGSPALCDSEGKLFHARLSPDSEWQIPISLGEMGKWLPKAATGIEDGRFYEHCGVDFLALMRAAFQNISSGRVVSGASTITSQLIRLAVTERGGLPGGRPAKQRDIRTKIIEFIMAMKAERIMTKDEILENYLNRAPLGGNIRGVQAASMIYFGKTASQLSPGEAALLIGMLKGPSLYRPDMHPEAARVRRDDMLRLLEQKGVLTSAEVRRAMLEALPGRRFALPRNAYHFAQTALRRSGNKHGRIDTTLRSDMQSKLEGIVTQALRELPPGVTIAAGVSDNRTAELTAWTGNARFLAASPAENAAGIWNDCGLAPRSPGSTLKPFAYLSAAEQGLIAPGTLLSDTAAAFSGRAPRNFDMSYRGAVSARTALASSLNAPAVRVLRAAGPERVLRLLRDFGFEHLNRDAGYYGDSLILGGCEVTLLEELEAFTALASLGVHRPLSVLAEENFPERRAASEEACWMICDMLDHRGPLSMFARGTMGAGWHAALKTGTSYGLRDAWTAAWTPDFTVVVWVGIPDGSSWGGLVGAEAAAPVAMSILRAVSPSSGWYTRPNGVSLRDVCQLSGQPPTAVCPALRRDWAIDGVTRTVPCRFHTIRDGAAAVIWPSEMAPSVSSQTPNNGAAGGVQNIIRRSNLVIVSPAEGSSYIMPPFDRKRMIPLRAEGASERVWWYADGKYAGTSLPNETIFVSFADAEDGEHVIGAADTDGRSTERRVKILTPGKKRKDDAAEVLH